MKNLYLHSLINIKCIFSLCWVPAASVTQNLLLWLIAAIPWFSTIYCPFVPTTQGGAPRGHPGCVRAAASCPQLHLGCGHIGAFPGGKLPAPAVLSFYHPDRNVPPTAMWNYWIFPLIFPLLHKGLCLFFPSQPMPGWGFVLLSSDMMTNCKWIIRST